MSLFIIIFYASFLPLKPPILASNFLLFLSTRNLIIEIERASACNQFLRNWIENSIYYYLLPVRMPLRKSDRPVLFRWSVEKSLSEKACIEVTLPSTHKRSFFTKKIPSLLCRAQILAVLIHLNTVRSN